MECTSAYVRPCSEFVTAIDTTSSTTTSTGSNTSSSAMQSDCALIENVYKHIISICTAGDLLIVSGTVKQWEQTLHRVVLFVCIWTFGVVSSTSRALFQEQFYTYYTEQIRNTVEDKIFPVSNTDRSMSIYDVSLTRLIEKEVYLHWISFDRVSMSTALYSSLHIETIETSTEDRILQSYRSLYYTTLQTHAADCT